MKIRSPNHLFSLLCLQREVYKSFVDNIASHYQEWKIEKTDAQGLPIFDNHGNPKYRILHPPRPALKALQKRIKVLVFDKVTLPIYVQGGVKKRDNVTNAALHKGNHYFFQTDVKSFFPTIANKQVSATLVRIGHTPSVASCLTKLTTYKGRLPQGAPTSTAIANLAFSAIDELIAGICERENLVYTRFVDDIVISGKHDFRSVSAEIVETVLNEGFKISRKKTFYKRGTVNITGVEVHQNYLTTTKDFEQSLLQQLSQPQLAGKLNYHMRVHEISRLRRTVIFKSSS